MNRIDRLTGMILLLQGQRVTTAEQIANHFEISVRTVYRDLAALGEAGVPIVSEAGVGYRLMRGYHMPPVMFTEDEAAALFISGEVAEQIADSSLKQALKSALLKVRSVLPEDRNDYLNRLKNALGVRFVISPDDEQRRSLMPVQDAVVRRRCLSLRYDAGHRGELSERVVEPLGLVYYARQWHLIGYCRLRGDFRDFRLDRMVEWEVLGEFFDGHLDFSLKRFLEEMIHSEPVVPAEVIVQRASVDRFRAELPGTPISETPLPGNRVKIEFLTCSVDWMSRWLLGFGTQVKVTAPPELKAALCEAALAVARSHSDEFVEA